MVPADQITERMARLEPVAMRLEVKDGKNNCILINDSYNSDLASLDIALDFLYRRSQSKGLKRTLILSDIPETGQSTTTLYRKVAQLVHSRGIEKIIGVGAEISSCASKFDIEKYFFPDTKALLASDVIKKLRNEIILDKRLPQLRFRPRFGRTGTESTRNHPEVNLGAMVANSESLPLDAQTGN